MTDERPFLWPPLLISRSSKGEFLRSSKGAVFEGGKSLKWQKESFSFFMLHSWENDSSWYYSKKGLFLPPPLAANHTSRSGEGAKKVPLFFGSLEKVWKTSSSFDSRAGKTGKKGFFEASSHTRLLPYLGSRKFAVGRKWPWFFKNFSLDLAGKTQVG